MKANIVNIFDKETIESTGKTFNEVIKNAVVDDLYDKYAALLKEHNLTDMENKITVWKEENGELFIFQVAFDGHEEDLYLQVAKNRLRN
jgi:fatty acid/phospholipid biosynthesis enzyme